MDENIPQLDKINEILDGYVTGIGINIKVSDEDISSYFNYTERELRAKDSEDCDTIAGLLLQKSTQIQVELNRHIRTKNWANEAIKAFIADKLSSYDKYMPYDVRKDLATQSNEYSYKLAQLIRTTQVYIDTLQFLPASLKNQADFFTNLARSKRRNEYESKNS